MLASARVRCRVPASAPAARAATRCALRVRGRAVWAACGGCGSASAGRDQDGANAPCSVRPGGCADHARWRVARARVARASARHGYAIASLRLRPRCACVRLRCAAWCSWGASVRWRAAGARRVGQERHGHVARPRRRHRALRVRSPARLLRASRRLRNIVARMLSRARSSMRCLSAPGIPLVGPRVFPGRRAPAFRRTVPPRRSCLRRGYTGT